MSAHSLNRDLFKALDGAARIPKVASGEIVKLGGLQFGVIRGFGAGTFKLPNPPSANFIGHVVFIIADGAQSWQNQAGGGRATLASGEVGIAVCISATDWIIQVIDPSAGDDFAATLAAALNTAASAAGTLENTETAIDSISGAVIELQQLALVNCPNTKFTTSSAASPVSPAASALAGAKHVFWQNTTDGAVTVNTGTAAALLAAVSGASGTDPAFTYLITFINRGDNTLTISAGSNVTITGETTLATLVTRTYAVTYTSATACTWVSVSKGTIET